MTYNTGLSTIDDYMALDWKVEVRQVDDEFVLTAWPLNDFAVYGDSEDEVRSEWRDALRAHLEGYLKVGKTIPTGRISMGPSNALAQSWLATA